MNELKDQRLQTLFVACFDRRSNIAEEARHLAGFFLEYKLRKHPQEQKKQYEVELKENEVFRAEYGDLQLYSGNFKDAEIAIFTRRMVKEFLSRPEERRSIARILKYAGTVEGVQEEIAEFVQKSWRNDEFSTDIALDIIWNMEVFARLGETLQQMVKFASNDVLRAHAVQLLELLKSVEKA